MGKAAAIITRSGEISVFACGKQHMVAPQHPNYNKIVKGLNVLDETQISKLIDIQKAFEPYVKVTGCDVELKNGTVTYNGKEIHGHLIDRIIQHAKEGHATSHLLKFCSNLFQNPAFRAVNETFQFLEHKALPVTDDGCVLAYKRVRADYTDCWSGKYDNHIGCKPEMPRNECDDNPTKDCSSGFHIGSIAFVKDWVGHHSDGSHIMVVKFNPKDVVSIPHNNCEKIRVCTYEVISEYTEDLNASVYSASTNMINEVEPEEDDEEVCDSCDQSIDSCVCDECQFCGSADCYGECLDEEDSDDDDDDVCNYCGFENCDGDCCDDDDYDDEEE